MNQNINRSSSEPEIAQPLNCLATLQALSVHRFLEDVILKGMSPRQAWRSCYGISTDDLPVVMRAIRPWLGEVADQVASLEVERARVDWWYRELPDVKKAILNSMFNNIREQGRLATMRKLRG